MLPGSFPCTKHYWLWGCHRGWGPPSQRRQSHKYDANIFRVSLAITLIYTTECYNPKQEEPMHPPLSHPCKILLCDTA